MSEASVRNDAVRNGGGMGEVGVLERQAFEYPAELECDVVDGAGSMLHLRPIRPSDADRLVAFHDRLSAKSVYRRYFSVHPELSSKEVVHLTTVDYVDRMAFIVNDGDEMVAVGRYDRISGTDEAEVAFLVADRYQHHGIGALLLEHLANAARPVGITAFTAETQADNRGMMGVFLDSGYPVTSRLEDEIFDVRFPIEPTEASQALRAEQQERLDALRQYREDQARC